MSESTTIQVNVLILNYMATAVSRLNMIVVSKKQGDSERSSCTKVDISYVME